MRRTWLNREFEIELRNPGSFDGVLRVTHEIINGEPVEIKNEIFAQAYSSYIFGLYMEHSGLRLDVPPVDLNLPNLKELLLKEKIESLMLTLQQVVISLRKAGTVKLLKDRATFNGSDFNFNVSLENN